MSLPLRSLVTLATYIIIISLLLLISLCLLYSWLDPRYWHSTFDKQFVCLSVSSSPGHAVHRCSARWQRVCLDGRHIQPMVICGWDWGGEEECLREKHVCVLSVQTSRYLSQMPKRQLRTSSCREFWVYVRRLDSGTKWQIAQNITSSRFQHVKDWKALKSVIIRINGAFVPFGCFIFRFIVTLSDTSNNWATVNIFHGPFPTVTR